MYIESVGERIDLCSMIDDGELRLAWLGQELW
jgi:hypothetical protein